MWQPNNLESFLADMDSLERRPGYRTAPSLIRERGRATRHSRWCGAVQTTSATERRSAPRRRSDPAAARSRTATEMGIAAGALLDHLDLAVVLLHRGAFVQLANAAARRIAVRGDCFRIRAQRLQMTDRQGQAALERFLNDDTLAESPHVGPRCLCRRSNGPCRYVILAERLDSSASPFRSLAVLLIYEPYRVGRVSAALIAPLYGLTPMESRLAAALYGVPKLGAAAARCGISLNTAKTHLKHVFSKCAVGSKAELLRLLALGPRAR